MKRVLNEKVLKRENVVHDGTGGRSQANSGLGFRPAFYDFATQRIYPSRFADGRLAPFHLLDGLARRSDRRSPAEWPRRFARRPR